MKTNSIMRPRLSEQNSKVYNLIYARSVDGISAGDYINEGVMPSSFVDGELLIMKNVFVF